MLHITKSIRIFFLSGLLLSRLLSAQEIIISSDISKKMNIPTRSLESDTKKAFIDSIQAIVKLLQNLTSFPPAQDGSGGTVCCDYAVHVSTLLQAANSFAQDSATTVELLNIINTLTASLNTIAHPAQTSAVQIIPLLQAINNVVAALNTIALNPNFAVYNNGPLAAAFLNVGFIFSKIINNSVFTVQNDINSAAQSAITIVAGLDQLVAQWLISSSSLQGFDTAAHTALAAFSTGATVIKMKNAAKAILNYITQLIELTAFRKIENLPVTASSRGLVLGPDGNYWTAAGRSIVKITPDGQCTSYTYTNAGFYDPVYGDFHGYEGNFIDVVLGADNNIWFLDPDNNCICKITMQGVITPYLIPLTAPLASNKTITGDRTSAGRAQQTLFGGVPVSKGQLVAGKDGNLWFLNSACYIGEMTTSGQFINNYKVFNMMLTEDVPLNQLGVDTYGNLWAANDFGNILNPAIHPSFFRMTPDGIVTEIYPQYNNYTPYAINFIGTSDGRLWFLTHSSLSSLNQQGVRYGADIPYDESFGMVKDSQDRIWMVGKFILAFDTKTSAVVPSYNVSPKIMRTSSACFDANDNFVALSLNSTGTSSILYSLRLNPS